MGATGGKVAECASVVENSPHSMAPLRCSRRRQPPSKVPDPADRKALQTPAARSGSGVGTVASCRSDGTASASQAAGAKHDAATPPPRPAVLTRPNSRAPSRPHARTSLLPEAQNSGMVGRSARGRPTRLPAAWAFAMPSRVRSLIKSRSNSATLASKPRISLDIASPPGRMSMPCVVAMSGRRQRRGRGCSRARREPTSRTGPISRPSRRPACRAAPPP